MSSPFIAEIRILGCNFAPIGWSFCSGQLISIAQNTALFSLIGTTFGGNGTTNFGLPNLQGKAPMQSGQGPGLSLRNLGETGGTATVTLLSTEMPSHTHGVVAATVDIADSNVPTNNNIGKASTQIFNTVGTQVPMSVSTISSVGGNQPHNNMMPYLVMNFCIAMQGVYPPRS
jgi:microcystin-dependent protein